MKRNQAALLLTLIGIAIAVVVGIRWSGSPRGEVPAAVGNGHETLTTEEVDRLATFAHLLGLVRHFHPSDGVASARTNWTWVATDGIGAVLDAENREDLADTLRRIFGPVAPSLRVDLSEAADPPALRESPAGASRVVTWVHVGYGQGTSTRGGGVYSSQRKWWPIRAEDPDESMPDPRKEAVVNLGSGLTGRMGTSLWADDDGTLPRSHPARPLVDDWAVPPVSDRATRLAVVMLAWTVLEHFYPYFDVVATDWDAALREALNQAATDTSSSELLATLRRLMAHLHDGHAGAYLAEGPRETTPPLRLRWIEQAPTVVAAAQSTGVQPGDVVLRIDGEPVERRIELLRTQVSAATDGWRWHDISQRLLEGDPGTPVRLTVMRQGTEVSVELSRLPVGASVPAESRPQRIAALRDSTMYIDLTRSSDEDLESAWDDLASARAVIFDMRGYPDRIRSRAVLAHLADSAVTSAIWQVPVFSSPDRAQWQWQTSRWPAIEPEKPRIAGKVVFLVDERAISYAESLMGIVEHYGLGEIVGSRTAGTNGNLNSIALPHGFHVTWTGMRVLKHDGGRHHGIGIVPTVQCSPSRQGITEGRDELLETAMRIAHR